MSSGESSRFGNNSSTIIDEASTILPANTKRSRSSVWIQFSKFCEERQYVLDASNSLDQIAAVLKDWGYNMKKCHGTDYKEAVIKVMWNGVDGQ